MTPAEYLEIVKQSEGLGDALHETLFASGTNDLAKMLAVRVLWHSLVQSAPEKAQAIEYLMQTFVFKNEVKNEPGK